MDISESEACSEDIKILNGLIWTDWCTKSRAPTVSLDGLIVMFNIYSNTIIAWKFSLFKLKPLCRTANEMSSLLNLERKCRSNQSLRGSLSPCRGKSAEGSNTRGGVTVSMRRSAASSSIANNPGAIRRSSKDLNFFFSCSWITPSVLKCKQVSDRRIGTLYIREYGSEQGVFLLRLSLHSCFSPRLFNSCSSSIGSFYG